MRLTLLITLCFLTIFGNAQNSWNLEKCIQYALENNIQIQQNNLNVELAEENLKQTKGNILPNLNAGVTHGYNWGQRIDPFTNQFATDRVRSNNFFLSSSATIFQGFQNTNSVKRDQYNLEASKSDAETTIKNTSLTIAATYLQILFNKELLAVARNQQQITKQQLERTNKLVEAGQLARNAALDLQAQLANEELNVVNAENNLTNSLLSMTQLLQLSDEEAQNFRIAEPNLENYEPIAIRLALAEIYNGAVENQPEVQGASARLKSAEKSVEIAKGMKNPSLSLNGSIGSGYSGLNTISAGDPSVITLPTALFTASGESIFSNSTVFPDNTVKPFFDQFDQNLNQNLSFNLNIPIFNGFSAKTSVSSAIINQKNAELILQNQKNQIKQDIQNAYADAIAAKKRFDAAKTSKDAFQESFKYAELRFQQKLINSVDYNDAKNKLANAQSDLIQSKYDYIFKTKILSFYMSQPLKL